jgi:hypothetical protein
MDEHMERYHEAGYPAHNDLYATGVIGSAPRERSSCVLMDPSETWALVFAVMHNSSMVRSSN